MHINQIPNYKIHTYNHHENAPLRCYYMYLRDHGIDDDRPTQPERDLFPREWASKVR